MTIAAVAIAILTVFLLIFHSIRGTTPNHWVNALIPLIGAVLSFFFVFTPMPEFSEAVVRSISLIFILSGTIGLLRLHLRHKIPTVRQAA